MKKLILPILVIFYLLVSSCKKEQEYGTFTFSPYFAQNADAVSYDSAYFLIINYSTTAELKTFSEVHDSTIYHHTLKVSLDKIDSKNFNYNTIDIRWEVGDYVIKKFDLVDRSDNVIYYIPYTIPEKYELEGGILGNIGKSSLTPLPLMIRIGKDRTSYSNSIIKK